MNLSHLFMILCILFICVEEALFPHSIRPYWIWLSTWEWWISNLVSQGIVFLLYLIKLLFLLILMISFSMWFDQLSWVSSHMPKNLTSLTLCISVPSILSVTVFWGGIFLE